VVKKNVLEASRGNKLSDQKERAPSNLWRTWLLMETREKLHMQIRQDAY